MNTSDLRYNFNTILARDIDTYDTQWGVAVLDNRGQLLVGHDENAYMGGASLNKLSIAYAADEAGIAPDHEVTLQASDKPAEGGNGILKLFPEGSKLPFAEVARRMLSISDDTAAKAIVRVIGGPSKVNDILNDPAASVWGSLLNEVTPNNADPLARWEYGLTTAVTTAQLLRFAVAHPVFGDALRHSNFTEGLRANLDSDTHTYTPGKALLIAKGLNRLGLTLPAPLRTAILKDQPPETAYPNKEGRLGDLYHDVGQMGGLIIAALGRSARAPDPKDGHHTRNVQARLGQLVSLF